MVPDVTLRARLVRHIDLGGWATNLISQINYVGAARLSFDADLDRSMGRYATVAAGIATEHGRWSATARLDNIFDIAGDSFAFGNPFSIRLGPQYTPLRPRTASLSVGYKW